jgi:LPS-assembly lipoprotein
MSSPERSDLRQGRLPAALMIAATVIAVSGCTVQPLYYAKPAEGPITSSIGTELSAVAIKPPTNRIGQEVRNHLIFLFGGGKGQPAVPRYTLSLVVVAVTDSTATIQVNDQDEPTAAILTAHAGYKLTDSTGRVVGAGDRQFTSSYDVPRQEFAAVRAQIDAENRAARELAELVRLAVAQDLARGPRPPAADAAATAGDAVEVKPAAPTARTPKPKSSG